MHVTDFSSIPPLTIEQFLSKEHIYNRCLRKECKKYFKTEKDRKAIHILAHDFLRQFGGI
jgi:hypothetical protein